MKSKFAVILLSALCMLLPLKAEAATAPAVTLKTVTKLSTSNAQINAVISNPGRMCLKRCGFILYDKNGKILKNRYDSINYTLKSFNGWFDLNQYYGKLSQGTTYRYRIYVMNSSKKYYYSPIQSFTTQKETVVSTIKKQMTAVAKTVVNEVSSKNKKLSYNAATIRKIGAQPKKSSYCSVYAISYARVAANKTPNDDPMKYWKNGLAYWSLGGMKSTKYSTPQAALKAVYDQINAGKPAILYVYGPKASQHYVTVIGYQNVTNENNLTMSNFVCLDPGYGTEMPLSTYTAPKMTYDTKGNAKGYQVVVF